MREETDHWFNLSVWCFNDIMALYSAELGSDIEWQHWSLGLFTVSEQEKSPHYEAVLITSNLFFISPKIWFSFQCFMSRSNHKANLRIKKKKALQFQPSRLNVFDGGGRNIKSCWNSCFYTCNFRPQGRDQALELPLPHCCVLRVSSKC